jgi:hypothetical protein
MEVGIVLNQLDQCKVQNHVCPRESLIGFTYRNVLSRESRRFEEFLLFPIN